jgi:acylphosphatase
VLAEGDRKSLEQLAAALQRGPRGAFVSDLRLEWEPVTGEFTSFRVRMSE